MGRNPLIFLSLLILLQACGFQLRGLGSLPEHLTNLRVQADSLSSSQQQALNEQLQRAGATLRYGEEPDAVRLGVTLVSLPERRIADSAGQGENIVRLARRLSFTVIDADGNRLADNKVIEQRIDLELDEDNLLGSEGEKQQALENLDSALFNSLMNQLRRL